jgi:hypothetical protein
MTARIRRSSTGTLSASGSAVCPSLKPVVVRICLVGDENPRYPSHRELNVVRRMLGPDVETVWLPTDGEQVRDLSDFDGVWLARLLLSR